MKQKYLLQSDFQVQMGGIFSEKNTNWKKGHFWVIFVLLTIKPILWYYFTKLSSYVKLMTTNRIVKQWRSRSKIFLFCQVIWQHWRACPYFGIRFLGRGSGNAHEEGSGLKYWRRGRGCEASVNSKLQHYVNLLTDGGSEISRRNICELIDLLQEHRLK